MPGSTPSAFQYAFQSIDLACARERGGVGRVVHRGQIALLGARPGRAWRARPRSRRRPRRRPRRAPRRAGEREGPRDVRAVRVDLGAGARAAVVVAVGHAQPGGVEVHGVGGRVLEIGLDLDAPHGPAAELVELGQRGEPGARVLDLASCVSTSGRIRRRRRPSRSPPRPCRTRSSRRASWCVASAPMPLAASSRRACSAARFFSSHLGEPLPARGDPGDRVVLPASRRTRTGRSPRTDRRCDRATTPRARRRRA